MYASVASEICDAAEGLVGGSVTAISPAGSGANSRIFRVDTHGNRFALKCYPERAGDLRMRSDVEWKTLIFLEAHGIAATPRAIARDGGGRYLLMEWIDGEPVVQHNKQDVIAAGNFVADIFALSIKPQAQEFSSASEACLSVAEILRQIEERLASLVPQPDIQRFLNETVVPLLDREREVLASELASGMGIAASQKRLIPADFGFHNALRAADGKLRYVDFDYFGWDDPVRLTADFMLHPAMALTEQETRLFVERIAVALPNDLDFFARLRRTLALYAVRWILILLNPFRADRVADLPVDGEARAYLVEDRLRKSVHVIARLGETTSYNDTNRG